MRPGCSPSCAPSRGCCAWTWTAPPGSSAPQLEWLALPRQEQWLWLVNAWLASERAPSLVGQPVSGVAPRPAAPRRGAAPPSTRSPPRPSGPDAPVVRKRILEILNELTREAAAADGQAPVLDAAAVLERADWSQPRMARRFSSLIRGVLAEAEMLGLVGSGALTQLGRGDRRRTAGRCPGHPGRASARSTEPCPAAGGPDRRSPGLPRPGAEREAPDDGRRRGPGPGHHLPVLRRPRSGGPSTPARTRRPCWTSCASIRPRPFRSPSVPHRGHRRPPRQAPGGIRRQLHPERRRNRPAGTAEHLRRLRPGPGPDRAHRADLRRPPPGKPRTCSAGWACPRRWRNPSPASSGCAAAPPLPGSGRPVYSAPRTAPPDADVDAQLAVLRAARPAGSAAQPAPRGCPGSEEATQLGLETLQKAIRLKQRVVMNVVDGLGNASPRNGCSGSSERRPGPRLRSGQGNRAGAVHPPDHRRRSRRGIAPVTDGPLIVQSDKTLLLEVDHELATSAATRSRPSPSWSAPPSTSTPTGSPRSACGTRGPPGTTPSRSSTRCCKYSRFPVPQALPVDIAETMARYGRLRLEKDPARPGPARPPTIRCSRRSPRPRRSRRCSGARSTPRPSSCTRPSAGSSSRCCSSSAGRPRTSPATSPATPHPIDLVEDGWALRPYQQQAVDNFCARRLRRRRAALRRRQDPRRRRRDGHGQATTLILVTNTVAARQWRDELLKRTSLTEEEIGEYSGARKEVRPVTIATYQILTTKREGVYAHLELLDAPDWGLVVYDEVHLLPAPVFRSPPTCRPGAASA